jgi:hypothetical protein
MQPARYTRLFVDNHGESHFEDVEHVLAPVDFAPPAPPLHVGALFPATRCFFVGALPDWDGGASHPSPRRQLFCVMQGTYTVTASDGTARHFSPGHLLLLEDTTGKGHQTRMTSTEDVLVFAVALDG